MCLRICVYARVIAINRKMLSPGVPVSIVYLLLSSLVLSATGSATTTSSDSNTTKIVVEEEDDELPEITLDEFKERYRRLIPYMTFYVANNYVNGQTAQSQAPSSKESFASDQSLRNNQQFVRLTNQPNEDNDYRAVNAQEQERRFVPSMRYDPRNIGGDNDYFVPLKYISKVPAYEDYPTPYHQYQDQKVAYPAITTGSSRIVAKANRYYANVRPSRPYTTNSRDHQSRKRPTKPIQANFPDEYLLDYNIRAGDVPTAVNYPVKDPQTSHRHVPPSNYPDVQTYEQSQREQSAVFPQQTRNPAVNLQQIAESLRLSERLPEMLSKDNLDNSLRTLMEILNILHDARQEELPQIQPPPLPSSISRPPQKLRNYKSRPHTRPKVITESRFQATPNPLYLTDDPERYKMNESPYEDASTGPTSRPGYDANDLTSNEKLVEYYVPVVQDVPIKGKQTFLATVRPQTEQGPPDHSYAITEDLSDDVVQSTRFTLPSFVTDNLVHGYTESNRVSTTEQSVTQTSGKHGATRGEAHVDYPAYASIPATNFSCKQQRYKGFFGDPDTGCQVWHYCDLNGGKSSFLCPNGTIFSQVALTCDWWFNVKCETTTQLYVLNERLYKYILPVMPKFPEDFSGPEVDRYLELKFKEMEAKLREKKLKKQQEEKEKLKSKPQTQKGNE